MQLGGTTWDVVGSFCVVFLHVLDQVSFSSEDSLGTESASIVALAFPLISLELF